jgi:hypothetical protein
VGKGRESSCRCGVQSRERDREEAPGSPLCRRSRSLPACSRRRLVGRTAGLGAPSSARFRRRPATPPRTGRASVFFCCAAAPPRPPLSRFHSFALSPTAALAAVSSTRLALVSGRFAFASHSRIARRDDGGNASHAVRAPGLAASAASRSAGTTSAVAPSSRSHEPFALAAAMAASPGAAIRPRPCASRASIFPLCTPDHPLVGLRREKYRLLRVSSTARGSESTQPQHSASSTASGAVKVGTPPFLFRG